MKNFLIKLLGGFTEKEIQELKTLRENKLRAEIRSVRDRLKKSNPRLGRRGTSY